MRKNEDIALLEEGVRDVKNIDSTADKAEELIAIADQITGTGVMNPEIGEKETIGLLNVPGAIDLLEEIRRELSEVLETDEEWDHKPDHRGHLDRIKRRISEADQAAGRKDEDRIQRRRAG